MLSAGKAGVETSRLEQISEWRGCFLSPDGVVGGSKGMDSVAVWSRHDLVPVLLSGDRIDEFALAISVLSVVYRFVQNALMYF